MTKQEPTNQPRLLRWNDVQARVGICRSQAHYMVQRGEFPAPVKIGARASAWVQAEIDSWIENRIALSRKKGDAA